MRPWEVACGQSGAKARGHVVDHNILGVCVGTCNPLWTEGGCG